MNETVYKVITDRIIGLLEQGTIPWQKPWGSRDAEGKPVLPQNLISRKPYRGVNVFLLPCMGFESPFWLSFKQAKELGGNVRKGEHACPVVFWKWLEVEPEEGTEAGDAKAKRIPMLRYYNVFNVAQCENIPAAKIPALTGSQGQHEPIGEAERIVSGIGAVCSKLVTLPTLSRD